MDQRLAVRQFVTGLLARRGDSEAFGDSTSLLGSGRLQSIDAVEIAMFLEGSFGINFADIGFDQETVDSVEAISHLIGSSAKSSVLDNSSKPEAA
jgi:acyl carrier protein